MNTAPPSPDSPEISCVVPAYNEEGNIGLVIQKIAEKMQRLERTYEIIVVDDGSSDQTLNEAKKLITSYPLRILKLSRNFGKEDAMMAGMKASKGKAVIIIDADMQEPVTTMRTFIQYWDDGYEMVYAVRAHRDDESFLKTKGSECFYWLLNKMTSVKIPPHARDFRLMDRKVVDAVCALPEHNRFMKGLFSWVGFKSKEVSVEIEDRNEGVSKFNYKQIFSLALNGITSFSNIPLRIWAGIGACISLLSIFYALWITVRTLIWGTDLPGWSSLAVAIFFLGGIQILSVGILGEYLSRIYSEVKARPGYIIAEELNASNAQPNERNEHSAVATPSTPASK